VRCALPSGQQRLKDDRFRAAGKGPWVAEASGFNVHAGVTVRAGDREGLERVCRYGARPPFSLERMAILPDGRMAYLHAPFGAWLDVPWNRPPSPIERQSGSPSA
jgi:hypothetical protein